MSRRRESFRPGVGAGTGAGDVGEACYRPAMSHSAPRPRRPAEPQGFDALVLGAGGAGLMCAAVAGQRGRRVLLIDHADSPGKKILISGGGRCNFTNLHAAPDRFLSANPHFAVSALARYTPADFLALVERARHRLAREDARPALLRRLGPADRRDAARTNASGAGSSSPSAMPSATSAMPTAASASPSATARWRRPLW